MSNSIPVLWFVGFVYRSLLLATPAELILFIFYFY